jgi:hypothetical protein
MRGGRLLDWYCREPQTDVQIGTSAKHLHHTGVLSGSFLNAPQWRILRSIRPIARPLRPSVLVSPATRRYGTDVGIFWYQVLWVLDPSVTIVPELLYYRSLDYLGEPVSCYPSSLFVTPGIGNL